ncbi:hypothetical protein BT67DRAFT_34413 [Trichocladium antarcticum]|uniref:Uncharacterized protein n=1 Tax=Trichocladium antarcticum TaxID=1450529 RepID=A0AAN6UJ07_9PEZI|nr:hypothetical protein BT67DRAFT_34413 [Trichocladium antarcticum]
MSRTGSCHLAGAVSNVVSRTGCTRATAGYHSIFQHDPFVSAAASRPAPCTSTCRLRHEFASENLLVGLSLRIRGLYQAPQSPNSTSTLMSQQAKPSSLYTVTGHWIGLYGGVEDGTALEAPSKYGSHSRPLLRLLPEPRPRAAFVGQLRLQSPSIRNLRLHTPPRPQSSPRMLCSFAAMHTDISCRPSPGPGPLPALRLKFRLRPARTHDQTIK